MREINPRQRLNIPSMHTTNIMQYNSKQYKTIQQLNNYYIRKLQTNGPYGKLYHARGSTESTYTINVHNVYNIIQYNTKIKNNNSNTKLQTNRAGGRLNYARRLTNTINAHN